VGLHDTIFALPLDTCPLTSKKITIVDICSLYLTPVIDRVWFYVQLDTK